jgi:ABC-type Fe3+ transport system permease subunit/DNA-binding beta-propeller fold protein YncE
MNTPLLLNSLGVASTVALLAVALGGTAALCALGCSARARAWLTAGAVLVLALPPFLVASAWLGLFGVGGVFEGGLGFRLFTPTVVVLVMALMFWPVSFLLLLGAWTRLPAELLESEPRLRGWSLLRWLLLPAAGPMAGVALAITFVLALNHFAIPALFQVRIYPAEVWIRFNAGLDPWGALALSWPMLVAPVVLLWIVRRREVPWPRFTGALRPALFRRQAGSWLTGLSGFVLVGLAGLSLMLPLGHLATNPRTWDELGPAVRAGGPAIVQSALLAACAATLTVVVALGTVRCRWLAATWLLFLMPGVVLGVLLIVTLNRWPLTPLYQSAAVVMLAWGLRFFAPAWSVVGRAFRSVDPALHDAARLEGAGAWDRFRLVIWPQAGGLLAAAWYVVFLFCLWDTETLVLIMPPGGETLALRIFNFLHYGHNAHVDALCLVLLGVAVLPIVVWAMARVLRRLGSRHAAVSRVAAAAIGALVLGTGCSRAPGDRGGLHSQLFGAVEVFGSRGSGAGQFQKPRSVAVDAADNFYVVDMTGRVQKFSPDGEYLGGWQMPESALGKPKGMCRDEQGRIVVLEPHYARVSHYSTDGALLEQWGQRGVEAGHLDFPRAVAVAPDGRIYVSEYMTTERVQVFDAERRLERIIGSAGRGAGEFNRAEGIGLDQAGCLYVADSCNHRIQVFGPDGRFLRAYGGPGSRPGELSYPYDVRVDAQGRQFVCEFGNSRIQVFDANGHWLETIGGPGAAPGRFSNPWALALDSRGNLYVADSMNHRVQKLIRRVVRG